MENWKTEYDLKDHLKHFKAGEERKAEANWLWMMNGFCQDAVWDVMVEIEAEEQEQQND